MKCLSLRECIPMLPWPFCPLVRQAIFGQNVVVGSMRLSSARRWRTFQEESAWSLVFFASEPCHGLMWSYQSSLINLTHIFKTTLMELPNYGLIIIHSVDFFIDLSEAILVVD